MQIDTVAIDGELLAGNLPYKQLNIVVGWLALHEEEAYAAWNKAEKVEHFIKSLYLFFGDIFTEILHKYN